jgi:hypothetical protein
MDFVRLLLLAGSFGVLVCAHVALLAGLWQRPPRRRVLAALLVAPLAPYYGFIEGRRRLSVTWLVALVLYGAGVISAHS